jgi:hypothetical protein
MKNYLIAAVALLFLTCTAQAQMVHLGIKGGLNGYTVMGGDSDFDPRLGYHFGVLTHIHLADKFALQPEVIYSAQGARFRSNNDIDLRLKYVNVPVLFQYMFGDGFRLEAGPQLGILAIAKTEFGNTQVDVKDDFQAVDVGLAAGVSYVAPTIGLGFDLRYNQGLTPINDSGPDNYYNSGLQLGIFYLFGH